VWNGRLVVSTAGVLRVNVLRLHLSANIPRILELIMQAGREIWSNGKAILTWFICITSIIPSMLLFDSIFLLCTLNYMAPANPSLYTVHCTLSEVPEPRALLSQGQLRSININGLKLHPLFCISPSILCLHPQAQT
jgi:hypothetical protein